MTSLLHLEAIWRIRQQKLFEDIDEHAIRWNKNKTCSCIKENHPELIICNHLLQDREKEFVKKIKKQFADGDLISSIALTSTLKPPLNKG